MNWEALLTAGFQEHLKKVWSKISFHGYRNKIIIQNFLINIFIINLTLLPLHLLPQLTIIFHFSLLLPCSLPWTYCCPSFGFIFQSLPSPVQVKKFIWKKFTLPRDTKSVPDLFRWFHRQNTGRSFQEQHRSGKINLVLLLHLSPNCTGKRQSVSLSPNFLHARHLFWKR